MTQQPALPNYLPSIDRRLEHAAGLQAATDPRRAASNPPATKLPGAKQLLGADFTHVIVAR